MINLLDNPSPFKILRTIIPGSVDEISFDGKIKFIRKRRSIRIPTSSDMDNATESDHNLAMQIRELMIANRLASIDVTQLNERQQYALQHIIVPKTFTMKKKI